MTSLVNIHRSAAGGRDDDAGGTSITEHKVSSIDVDEIELLQTTRRDLFHVGRLAAATAPRRRHVDLLACCQYLFTD